MPFFYVEAKKLPTKTPFINIISYNNLQKEHTSGKMISRSSESWSIDVFASTSKTPSARITT